LVAYSSERCRSRVGSNPRGTAAPLGGQGLASRMIGAERPGPLLGEELVGRGIPRESPRTERSAGAPRMIRIDEARAALSGDRPRSCGRLFLSGDTRWEEAGRTVISHDCEVISLSAVRGIDSPILTCRATHKARWKPSGTHGIYRPCRPNPDTSRLPWGDVRGKHEGGTARDSCWAALVPPRAAEP